MKKEKVLAKAVVVFIVNEKGEVLLAQKVVGRDEKEIKIGEGKWNGLGGGLEFGETLEDASKREVLEETRRGEKSSKGIFLQDDDLELRAVVFCHNTKSNGRKFKCKLFVFLARNPKGEAEDSPEMINHEYFRELPYGNMIPTDKDWMPLIFREKLFIARVFLRNSQTEKIGETQIRFVRELPCN